MNITIQQNLALFDFDGTITRKDSFFEFIKYYKGNVSLIVGIIILSPILLLYKTRIIKNWKAKEKVFTYFFKYEPFEKFSSKGKEFSLKILPEMIKPKALETIFEHKRNGDRVLIISASYENWLIDWCNSLNIELIGSKIEVRDGVVTGKFDGKNCYGIEKVTRLNQYLDISQYFEIYAYGDSKSDWPLLELANHRFYKYFH
jgi:HAD superfamily hydrolase (TIGR01490 family)